MTHPTPAELLTELEGFADAETDKLGDKAAHYVRLKALTERCDTAKKAAYNDLMAAMEEQGTDGIKAAGANVTRKIIKSWGIAEGGAPEDRLQNMQAARDWINEKLPHNPETVKPTTTLLKKAWEETLMDEPDATLPTFMVEHERGQLSVRKA